MLSRIRDRLDAAVNPILVKEMYQSVHSKFMMALFWLLLLLCLLIYFVSVAGADTAPGGSMFAGFSLIMSLMMLFLLPAAAFFALYREITSQTIELVLITSMSARRLVRGRLLAAGVRILLVFALIAPFAVASFLFGGIDLSLVLGSVYQLLLMSVAGCAVAVFFGALAMHRSIRLLASLSFFAVLLLGCFTLLGAVPGLYFALRYMPIAAAGPSAKLILAALGWETAFTVLGVMFVASGAANSLTFAHDRSSARAKVIALAIVLAYAGALVSLGALGSAPVSFAARPFEIGACVFLAACSLFWITGHARMPVRHRVKLARRGRFVRAVYFVFRDGAGSTAVYLALALALVAVCASVLRGSGGSAAGATFGMRSGAPAPAYSVVPLVLTYVLYLSALAGLFTLLLPPWRRTAGSRRTALLLIVIVNATIPILLPTAPLVKNVVEVELGGAAVAFVPSLYLASLDAVPNTAALLGHMALPFLLGLAYHVAVGLKERASMGAVFAASGVKAAAEPRA